MKILEVDIGNSRMKWRLRRYLPAGEAAVLLAEGKADLEGCLDALLLIEEGVDKIAVSCVVPSLEKAFADACVARWQRQPAFARVRPHCAGVTNGYDDVTQMGVDRWLAMLAAYAEFGSACLVVDTGTAPTVDLLLASGIHFGGYITPGFSLMAESLLSGTKIRDVSASRFDLIDAEAGVAVGRSTPQAISAGLCAMQVGLIRMGLEELIAAGAQKPCLIFSGGGSACLSQWVASSLEKSGIIDAFGPIVLRPTLVLDGLLLAV